MQNTKCQVVNHDQRRIISICLDTQCKANKAACQICLLENHKGHVDKLINSDHMLYYIRTQAEHPVDPKIKQTLENLVQVQKYLEELQKLIQKEVERLNSQNLQNVCKGIGKKYQILGDQVQGLENQKWNSLAEDMLKDFEVQNCKIIPKESIVNSTLGQDFKQFTNAFSSTMTKIENQFKLLNEVIEQKEIKINFEKFTDSYLLSGHTDLVLGIDICRHRNLLASSSNDKTVKLWNLENNTLIKTYQYSNTVYDVVFSKQGNLLAFGGYSDYSVKLIDISDLKKDNPILELKGHKNYVYRLTFSNDSKYLISASNDKTVIIWDFLQRKQLFQLNSGGRVNGVGISDDDTLLASNSYDGNIIIWNFKNQNLLCTQKAHGNGSGIQFSKDQKMLVSCGFDGMIKLWSLAELNNQSKLLLIREFKTATKCIWTALFSPCSKFIITMSNQDREIKVIDSETGAVVKLFKSKATNGWDSFQVAISKDMDVIAYGEDNNVVVWRQK